MTWGRSSIYQPISRNYVSSWDFFVRRFSEVLHYFSLRLQRLSTIPQNQPRVPFCQGSKDLGLHTMCRRHDLTDTWAHHISPERSMGTANTFKRFSKSPPDII
jgi:hypothetical protein